MAKIVWHFVGKKRRACAQELGLLKIPFAERRQVRIAERCEDPGVTRRIAFLRAAFELTY